MNPELTTQILDLALEVSVVYVASPDWAFTDQELLEFAQRAARLINETRP